MSQGSSGACSGTASAQLIFKVCSVLLAPGPEQEDSPSEPGQNILRLWQVTGRPRVQLPKGSALFPRPPL